MTEQEYINARTLGHVTCSKESLLYVLPSITPIIDKEEYKIVTKFLRKWETDLMKEIKIV